MARFWFCFIFAFFLSSCSHVQDGYQGYLKMPGEFAGYWEPVSSALAGVGIEIRPGIILHKDDPEYYEGFENLTLRFKERYKVFYIDEKYVYAITEFHSTPEWIREQIEQLGYEYEKEPERFNRQPESRYFYKRIYINTPYFERNRRRLFIGEQDCDLTEEDWNLPADVHRERLLSGYCQSLVPVVDRDFSSNYCWDRFITDSP